MRSPGSTEPERVRHWHPVEGCEAHRRIDRLAVADGCDRGAAAKVTDDESRHVDALGGPLRGDSLEPEAMKPELQTPLRRDRVGRRLLGQGGMEGRVEDGDMGLVGDRPPGGRDRLERGRVVERRELRERVEFREDAVVDQDGLAKAVAAVDDSVSDCGHVVGDRFEGRQRLGVVVVVHERELEAGGAGVDDEDVQ